MSETTSNEPAGNPLFEQLEPRLLLSGFSTYLGGSLSDTYQGPRIAVDAVGNSYVTGMTESTDFPTTAGAVDTSQNGDFDVFVAKFAPDGALAWSTFLGGSGFEQCGDIALDAAGNVYVTGSSDSSDFPTTTGVVQPNSAGGWDVFVAKLDPTGSALLYSTYMGGSTGTPGAGGPNDIGFGIAVDASGNAFVTGCTCSTDFPTTPGAFQTSIANPWGFIEIDTFVFKLNPTGSGLAYSTYLGGSNRDFGGTDIAVDAFGNAYIAGATRSGNFPTTAGAYDTTHNGFDDAHVTKLNPSGSGLVYSTFLGGGSGYGEGASGIALDASGNACVTGRTNGGFPTTAGAFQTVYAGGTFDVFVTKLNGAGSGLVFSTYLGGNGDDNNGAGSQIALDAAGNAFVTSATTSTDFPTTPGATQPTLNGPYDAFVTKLDPTGSALLDSTYLGGSGTERGFGIAVDTSGNAYVTGATDSTDFPVTPGAFDSTHNGNWDAFVTKRGVPEPAEAIQEVADELGDLANDPEIPPEAAAALNDALEELDGKNNGRANNGVIDKIRDEDTNAAFVKMIKALDDLEDAEAADPALDLTALKQAIALAADSLAVDAVAEAEAAASTPEDYENLAAAQAFLHAGQELLGQNDFLSALKLLRRAAQKADAVIN